MAQKEILTAIEAMVAKQHDERDKKRKEANKLQAKLNKKLDKHNKK